MRRVGAGIVLGLMMVAVGMPARADDAVTATAGRVTIDGSYYACSHEGYVFNGTMGAGGASYVGVVNGYSNYCWDTERTVDLVGSSAEHTLAGFCSVTFDLAMRTLTCSISIDGRAPAPLELDLADVEVSSEFQQHGVSATREGVFSDRLQQRPNVEVPALVG